MTLGTDERTPLPLDLPDLGDSPGSNPWLDLAREEVARLDPDARAAVVRRLREHGEAQMRAARRTLDGADTRPTLNGTAPQAPAKREPQTTPAQTLLGCAAALVLVAGFVAFWYGMVAGVPHRSASSAPASPAWGVAKYVWCALLTAMLVRDLRRRTLIEAWAVARQVRPVVLVQNALVLAVTVATGMSLVRLFPSLDRSWLYLIPGFHGRATNIGLMPVDIKYFGAAFLLLLAVSIPGLARSEERRYRDGTRDWRHGARRSLRFGLGHCVVGVPVYAGLALCVGGLWFTYQYFRGGVERSTLHHATYNWIITGLVLLFVILRGIG